jgi:hypothetical protein
VEVRRLRASDLPALERFWQTAPWSVRISELRDIAAAAAEAHSTEHRGLCAVDADAIAGVALFRFVAGSVQTGEIECIAGTGSDVEVSLLRAALTALRSDGGRLTVAEYPGSPEWRNYETLLLEAGFRSSISVADYFADGVPLRIALI